MAKQAAGKVAHVPRVTGPHMGRPRKDKQKIDPEEMDPEIYTDGSDSVYTADLREHDETLAKYCNDPSEQFKRVLGKSEIEEMEELRKNWKSTSNGKQKRLRKL